MPRTTQHKPDCTRLAVCDVTLRHQQDECIAEVSIPSTGLPVVLEHSDVSPEKYRFAQWTVEGVHERASLLDRLTRKLAEQLPEVFEEGSVGVTTHAEISLACDLPITVVSRIVADKTLRIGERLVPYISLLTNEMGD